MVTEMSDTFSSVFTVPVARCCIAVRVKATGLDLVNLVTLYTLC